MIVNLKDRIRKGELLSGTWLNLGSVMTAEIAGKAGFDWVCIDCEHGAGDHTEMLHQLHAVGCTPTAPLVRVAWNDPVRFKRVLDMGASGIVVPYVTDALQAHAAVSAMRYPPAGVRGVSKMTRAADFSKSFGTYFAQANEQLVLVVQIETRGAVEQVPAIAAVEGVDVVFIGPLDLTVSLGCMNNFEHPDYKHALKVVVDSCRKEGKAAGILVGDPKQIPPLVEMGFTFIGIASDGGVVLDGLCRLASTFDPLRRK